MSLAQLEEDFQSFVLERTAQTGGRMADEIVGTARVPVETRLAIYFDAYRARLTEALENNFPILAKLLGAHQFAELAQAYLARHRSAHFSIRWYGEQLALFLAQEIPYREQPLLAELARWEWNMTLAFDAADALLLQRNALTGLTPEEWSDLTLTLHPSVHMLVLHGDAPAVWRALNRDEAPPEHALASGAANGIGQEKHWMIWRRGLETFFRSLEPLEAAALQAAARGTSLAGICELLAQDIGESDAPQQAAVLLARWLEDEMLAA